MIKYQGFWSKLAWIMLVGIISFLLEIMSPPSSFWLAVIAGGTISIQSNKFYLFSIIFSIVVGCSIAGYYQGFTLLSSIILSLIHFLVFYFLFYISKKFELKHINKQTHYE